MGITAWKTPWTGDHLLRHSEGAEVLAPRLSCIGPACDECSEQGGSTYHRKHDSIAVGNEDAHAETGDQQPPLQLDVMTAEPG